MPRWTVRTYLRDAFQRLLPSCGAGFAQNNFAIAWPPTTNVFVGGAVETTDDRSHQCAMRDDECVLDLGLFREHRAHANGDVLQTLSASWAPRPACEQLEFPCVVELRDLLAFPAAARSLAQQRCHVQRDIELARQDLRGLVGSGEIRTEDAIEVDLAQLCARSFGLSPTKVCEHRISMPCEPPLGVRHTLSMSNEGPSRHVRDHGARYRREQPLCVVEKKARTRDQRV